MNKTNVQLLSYRKLFAIQAQFNKRINRSLNFGVRRVPLCPQFAQKLIDAKSANSTNDIDGAETNLTDFDQYQYQYQYPQEAFQNTLKLLDWGQLCEDVSQFNETTIGKQRSRNLRIPNEQKESEILIGQTRAMGSLLDEFMVNLEFGGIPSLEAKQAISRSQRGGMLSGEQLVFIAQLVQGALKIVQSVRLGIQKLADSHDSEALLPIVQKLEGLSNMNQQIHRHIFAQIDEETSQVRDNASDQLQKARNRVRTLTNKIKSILQSTGGEVSTQNGRLCTVRPLSDFGGTPPKNAILLGQATGGQYIYIEPRNVVQLNNDLAAARGEMYGAEEVILWQLTGMCMEDVDSLENCLNIVTDLDCMMARWKYTQWIGGVLPEFVSFAEVNREEREFAVHLQQLNHPLLLSQHLKSKQKQVTKKRVGKLSRRLQNRKVEEQAEERYEGRKKGEIAPPPVPINIIVGNKVRCVIITGPNTGGKTACLKSVGLSILMGKVGLGVSADPPIYFPCYSSVLADIGDEQSLTANLSTFSGHLKRIQSIREESDGKCLVLLDEVGTGTDPTEGSALGIAILKTLVKGGVGGAALTMATSHHTPLTALKYQDPMFENASMEFDDEKLAPTYRLLWGIPGRSNALNIARRLGMDEDIIQTAVQRLGEQQATIETKVEKLEIVQRKLQQEQQSHKQLLKKLEELRAYSQQLDEQIQQADVAARQRREEAVKQLVKKAQYQLKQISERKKREKLLSKRNAADGIPQEYDETAGQVGKGSKQVQNEDQSHNIFDDWVPKVGEEVYVPRLRSNAKIIKIGRKGDLELQAKMIRTKVLIDEVKPV